jgi:hypothetical protein
MDVGSSQGGGARGFSTLEERSPNLGPILPPRVKMVEAPLGDTIDFSQLQCRDKFGRRSAHAEKNACGRKLRAAPLPGEEERRAGKR